MKLSSANLIALGQRELRAIGEKCDPACFTWYACANSKPDGICAGFDLLDGETRRHLHKLLSEDDGKYVVNCMRMLQSGSNEEGLVQEVLRCLPESHRETRPKSGFMAQLEASSGNSNITPSENTEPEQQPTSAFRSMLQEASGKGKKMDVVERQNQSSPVIQQPTPIDFEYQLPQICNDSCFIKRHCGAYPAQVGSLCVKRSEQFKNVERILK